MQRMKAPAAVATVIACIATLAPAILGYSTYAKWGTLEAWFYVNPLNGDVSSSSAISALQSAMNVWNTQSGTPFRFWYAGQVGDTTTSNDKRNVIIFRHSTNGGAIASTYSWTNSGVLVDSDIVFWDGGFKFFTGSSGCTSGVYIEDVAAHELGHSMGLSHSNVTGATMTPGYLGCTMTQRSIESDDKAGAQKLYGTSGGATNTAPSVTITSPANGISITTGTNVTFTGSATDTQQGNLTSLLVWRSNLLGQIGTGGSFTRSLTEGTHAITATVTDSGGLTTQRGITVYIAAAAAAATNTAPAVTIASPANGLSVPTGTAISFSGSASDTQQGNLTSQLVWQSSRDGQIGTGGSFTRVLSTGTHTITATVTDGGGMTSAASRSVTVTSGTTTTNTAPSVTISSPANGMTGTAGVPITFVGSASDTQQGNLTSQLAWSSDRSGQIGTGGSFATTLKSGTHVITARVTDSGGLTTQRVITVYVVMPAL